MPDMPSRVAPFFSSIIFIVFDCGSESLDESLSFSVGPWFFHGCFVGEHLLFAAVFLW